MGEPIKIEIMGQRFLLKGEHDQEYVKCIENYINNKINEVQKTTSSINSYSLMVLVAINLVDDYLKREREIKELVNTVEDKSKNLIKLIDSSS